MVGATDRPHRVPTCPRVNGPILAPGLGAQGATAADLRRVFDGAGGVVLPTTSRDVLRAGPSVDGLREAAMRVVDEVRAALNGRRDGPMVRH